MSSNDSVKAGAGPSTAGSAVEIIRHDGSKTVQFEELIASYDIKWDVLLKWLHENISNKSELEEVKDKYKLITPRKIERDELDEIYELRDSKKSDKGNDSDVADD